MKALQKVGHRPKKAADAAGNSDYRRELERNKIPPRTAQRWQEAVMEERLAQYREALRPDLDALAQVIEASRSRRQSQAGAPLLRAARSRGRPPFRHHVR
jgi:hypothetical protein